MSSKGTFHLDRMYEYTCAAGLLKRSVVWLAQAAVDATSDLSMREGCGYGALYKRAPRIMEAPDVVSPIPT